MANVSIQAAPEDLYQLIGRLSRGVDPLRPLGPEEDAQYVALGQQLAEFVLLRQRIGQVDAALLSLHQQLQSGLSVESPAEASPEAPPAEAPDEMPASGG